MTELCEVIRKDGIFIDYVKRIKLEDALACLESPETDGSHTKAIDIIKHILWPPKEYIIRLSESELMFLKSTLQNPACENEHPKEEKIRVKLFYMLDDCVEKESKKKCTVQNFYKTQMKKY